jgi:transposase
MARSQELARLFQQPDSPTQRRYEICRAYFLEGATAQRLAQPYQLHVGTVRAVIRDFASDPDLSTFFLTEHPGRKSAPKRAAIQERACELRRQGTTLGDIRATLQSEGLDVSESYLFRVLGRAGLTAVRHRRSTPQPGEIACDGSVVPDIADVRTLSLEAGRRFSSKVAGLFLFLPMLLELDLPAAVNAAGLPGSEPIPPLQALLAILTPKLLGKRRVSHISDLCNRRYPE